MKVQNEINFKLQGRNPKNILQGRKPKMTYITWGKTLLTLFLNMCDINKKLLVME